MKESQLLESELEFGIGKYEKLDIDRTKKHLSEFKDNVVYHPGYIPESFNTNPDSPKKIVYIHIDVNSAKTTHDCLEFFYPRLVHGGVVLFDDYGWTAFRDTKQTVDQFFHDKHGIIFKLPTGQAIYFNK